MFRYFTLLIVLTVIGYLYEKYKLKYVPDEELEKYDLVPMVGFDTYDRIQEITALLCSEAFN